MSDGAASEESEFERLRLGNEFAEVEVTIDEAGNGQRLKISDLRTGRSVLLDPITLAGLTTARTEDFVFLLDPGRQDRP